MSSGGSPIEKTGILEQALEARNLCSTLKIITIMENVCVRKIKIPSGNFDRYTTIRNICQTYKGVHFYA